MTEPVAIKINLVPKDPFFETFLGRTLKWALSGGRYIVIFTELLVILSFIARFTLDRQVTDLNSEIHQKQTIIESYGELESQVRATQTKIDQYKQVEQQKNIVELFPEMTAITPANITLEQLTLSSTQITLAGSTESQVAFNILVNNLQLSDKLTDISISQVESQEGVFGLSFVITAQIKGSGIEKTSEKK